MSLSVQAISVTPSPGNQMANHLGGGSLINKGAKNLVVTELYNLVACEVFRLRCIFLNNFFFFAMATKRLFQSGISLICLHYELAYRFFTLPESLLRYFE